jgi:hypothetical protein
LQQIQRLRGKLRVLFYFLIFGGSFKSSKSSKGFCELSPFFL